MAIFLAWFTLAAMTSSQSLRARTGRLWGLLAGCVLATTLAAVPAGAQDVAGLEPQPPQIDDSVAEETIGDSELAELAADPASAPHGTTVDVEVHGPDLAIVTAAIEAAHGEPYGRVPGFFVEARVPVFALERLNATNGVTRVAQVTTAIPASQSLQINPALTNTIENTLQLKAWHDVGHKGVGQKVGILDIFGTEELEFAIAQGRVPAPAGTFCQEKGRSCAITVRNGGPHGVAVAEIIHRVAPDAELFFATVATIGDLAAAIDWFAEQGVTVINRSETSEFDGAGDGSGPTAALVNRAVSQDMIWVAAGGNAGGSEDRPGQNWIGQFNDPDGNGFHNWADGSERMGFTCGFLLGMRWDDWDTSTIATDYDIWIYDDEGDLTPEARGEDTQNEAAHRPLEHIETRCSGSTDRDYLAIRRFGDPQPDGVDTIQILGNQTLMDEWVNESAATGPGADSRSTGALTVGATVQPASPLLADYSSHGPTFDGRNGVDLAGPSCLPVPDFFNFCFSGTSASAPVVSGVMAVMRGANVIDNATDAEGLIPKITVDQGEEGADTRYGHGSLSLPAPVDLNARSFLPSCAGVPATIVGTNGDDVLVGTERRDVIFAGLGNDTVNALGGDDLICGGFGDDTIDAGDGNDTILGGPGADRIRGRGGADDINGGHGHDDIEGNAGNDELKGFTGRDYLKGGLGDDAVFGGAGNDRLVGGKGLDELFGGNGVDRCRVPVETTVSCRP